MRSRIEPITTAYMNRNLKLFHSIESNWTEVGERPWDETSFVLNLPRKWDLSFTIRCNEQVVGYIIGSQETERRAKVNKILVDKPYRDKGFGRKLICKFEKQCLAYGLNEIELKALVENVAANRFYEGLGYELAGTIEGLDGKKRNIYIKRLK
jgi:ribosomal protein S18 acetylase RimI-like enzyme